MRISEAGLALIERNAPGEERQILTQWNERWRMFSLVGGHVEPGESFRDCCRREVAEELGLLPEIEFAVAELPVKPLREYVAMSGSTGVETLYRVELYRVKLIGEATSRKVDEQTENCWLNEREIRILVTAAHRPVSEQVRTVLTLFGVM